MSARVLVVDDVPANVKLLEARLSAEYFDVEPLLWLYPEYGGVDPETGRTNVRQSLTLQLFGRTISGKAVATEPIPVAFNFTCGN